MATAVVKYQDQDALGNEVFKITDLENVATVLQTRARDIQFILIDNRNNAAKSYFKAWNDAAPTVGTTAPNMCLPAGANEVVPYIWPAYLDFFDTALTCACVTTAGTAGTTSPTSAVDVYICMK